MPTTYAHWRFGCECIETLPQNLKDIVHSYRELFDIGVHGPDIFFYDLRHKDVVDYGYQTHYRSGRDFFENAIRVYKSNSEDKDAMMAYMLGFLSHFALDSQCHGYVDRKKEVSGISHNKVESEYDAHLMRQEGKAVAKVDRSASLKPDKFTSKIIARFFPFDEKIMGRTTKWHQMIIRALVCKSNLKRKTGYSVLEKLKMPDYRDLIVMPDGLDITKDSNLRLDKLKAHALIIYPELVDDLMNAIENDAELPVYFDHTFEKWEDYQQIPVLSINEELEYKPELRK
ncbi:MAG: zinc dependent phospholipase C family protein [Erysipelotrichaceae bacterium]|nr:zinc dependent phospholipase C family protein [Erysipelotrichaceae bacterium]MBP5279550.1 zinc dependent phospholipase C family protein [Erysipelotrichaceae bacterium]